jgi:hypothetical protein
VERQQKPLILTDSWSSARSCLAPHQHQSLVYARLAQPRIQVPVKVPAQVRVQVQALESR